MRERRKLTEDERMDFLITIIHLARRRERKQVHAELLAMGYEIHRRRVYQIIGELKRVGIKVCCNFRRKAVAKTPFAINQ
jgi:hypothetical protein